MVLNFYFTKTAENQLNNIYLYSIDHWGIDRANLYMRRLEELLETLGKQPFIAKKRDHLGDDIYSFPTDSHVIYFQLTEDRIIVLAILHKSQLAQIDL